MNLRQSFRIAFKSIGAKKGRSFLTMLGIIIGVAAVIILVSLVQGYRDNMMAYWAKQGQNIINIYYSTWYQSKNITQDLYDYCLQLDEYIDGVTPSASLWGMNVKYGTKTLMDGQVFLGSDQYSICTNMKLASGRDLSYIDVKNANRVCILGDYARENLFNYANPIGKRILINGEPFTVVGVYKALYPIEEGKEESVWMHQYYDGQIVIPYTAKRLLQPSMEITAFTVKAKDKDSTTKAISYLGNWFSTRITPENGYYDVSSANTYIESSNEETRMLQIVLGGIAGIALMVGGIGIMNIMLVTVSERTREIGIRKAIGAERRAIVSQFLIESSVLSFLGGLIGIAVGALGTVVLGKVIFDLTLYPSMVIGAGAAGISVFIGIIFGAYPAVRASGLQPVEALRAE
ncbi:MAG: FtsX-like permease family protein [Clostridiales bacterium]|nr:FtsX-like permease family protein [Clostridiales bacterium]